uniref:NHL repeat-containing protein n=1 Tax=Candidatus Kentrum sp. SD TaxID=2126332 RepID=A0A450YSP5_9GAMM|nr:MAG: hypothetical protein BECKSD772F_GA0070984_10417 [Candidatus Kentron sp. SD]VFK44535.1 MAG: hypothetical protein BECKSD772E_GA0070983_10397 [Candidatus Kentron sp. SD]
MKRAFLAWSLRRNLIIAAILVAFFVGFWALYTPAPVNGRYELRYSDNTYKITSKTLNSQSYFNNNHVSIAQVDGHIFITANYTNLFLLDLENHEGCVLTPDSLHNEILDRKVLGTIEERRNAPKPSKGTVYNPTGVHVDEEGDLYVANYKGNNILKGRIDVKGCKVAFFKSYRSRETGGPENVFVDRDKDVLVSANYDAGTVTAFRVSTGTQIWSARVRQAHGVAIKGNKVYATGLRERKVHELDLADGRHLRAAGSLGWNPSRNEFLWPTAVYPFGENELVIADPQTGFISFMDQESLHVKRYTGGNGPGHYRFNYPYAAVPTQKGLLVMSSQRGEILELNRSAKEVSRRFRLRDSIWSDLPESLPDFGDGWRGYINAEGPKLLINNNRYRLGFAQLHPLLPGPVFRVPNTGTLYNTGAYIYLLQGGQVGDDFAYFFSSSSGSLIGIYSRPGKPTILLKERIPLDSWLVGHQLKLSDGSSRNESDLRSASRQKALPYFDEIETHDWTSQKSLFRMGHFSDSIRKIGFDKFIEYLDAVFVSPEGRAFKLAYDRCSPEHCDTAALKSAAKSYYFEALGRSYVNLDEYLLVGMLSGITPAEAVREDKIVVYDDCRTGKYYKGHGPRALATRSLEDYLSAHDLGTSSVCFSIEGKHDYAPNEVLFVWYSKTEIPKKMALFGLSENNESTLLRQVDNIIADDIVGVFETKLHLDVKEKFSRYKVELLEGGTQNRLLLRALTPIFVDNKNVDTDKLLRLTIETSALKKYGIGFTKLPKNTSGDAKLAHIISTILAADSAHCGHYATYFVSQLPSESFWRAYDLKTTDGRIHTVVEVHDNGTIRTADPTLGIVYNCSVQSMLDGKCNFDRNHSNRTVSPIMERYHGAGFFYGASIKEKYSSIDELISIY